jgi:hypothetical protein
MQLQLSHGPHTQLLMDTSTFHMHERLETLLKLFDPSFLMIFH